MFIINLFVITICYVRVASVKIDVLNCGIDPHEDVPVGDIDIKKYGFVGILYYSFDGSFEESRAVTTVALIQEEFCIGAAADIGPMPKTNFRRNSRVLLGAGWEARGRGVRNYVLHPEYGETINTLALIQLKEPVRETTRFPERLRPVCPPPDQLVDPEFFVIKFKEDYETLQKEVVPMSHVPARLCSEFYVAAKLNAARLRPPRVVCAVSLLSDTVCTWLAGSMLLSRDVWGRWRLLGVGVRGPGCGAPARYLDLLAYLPWLEHSLEQFQMITVTKINKHKYVLRQGFRALQKYGSCDPEEKINLLYREVMVLRTDNMQYQFITYNMSIYQDVEISCLTLEVVNASAVTDMSLSHYCVREDRGGPQPCYRRKGSAFHISAFMMFSDKCLFEMYVWGFKKNLTLLDKQLWKWEEGTYYEDFWMSPVEYRGPADQTLFGFEPIDDALWLPQYDIWSTTEYDNSTTTTEVPIDKGLANPLDDVKDKKKG